MGKATRKRGTRIVGLGADQVPMVAILMETSRSFGRGVIRGVSNYVKAHGPWNFYLHPGDFDQRPPPVEAWRIDAVIGRISSHRILSDVRARNIPIVCLEPGVYQGPRYVKGDQAAVCELAFTHLHDAGFRRLAFCGLNTYWGNERREHFGRYVRAAGMEFHNFEFDGRCGKTPQWQLGGWLERLPKPVGLMAQDDLLAREIIDICRFVGINVPEQVAVIGVDNDELVCELSNPTLSSIELNCERIGFEAARALECLLSGNDPGPTVLVAPIRVVARQSTDSVGIGDSVVAEALRFIRAQSGKPINVGDLSRKLSVSRRALEARFEKVLGRPPHEEMLQCRVARARELLISTDMKLSIVSAVAGFSSVQYMHRVFQQRLRQTPGEFRAANRPFRR